MLQLLPYGSLFNPQLHIDEKKYCQLHKAGAVSNWISITGVSIDPLPSALFTDPGVFSSSFPPLR